MIYEASELELLDVIKRTSLAGIQDDILKFAFLHYVSTPAVESWLSCFLWKIIYNKNTPLGIFYHQRVRYFSSPDSRQIIQQNVMPENKGEEEKIIMPANKVEESSNKDQESKEIKIEEKKEIIAEEKKEEMIEEKGEKIEEKKDQKPEEKKHEEEVKP